MKRSDKTDLHSEFQAMRKRNAEKQKQPLEDVGLFPIVVDRKEYNNAEELFCNYTIPDRFVTFTMLDKMCKNQKAVNERKALLDSRAELAKALQYIKKDGHKLLQMYADSEDKNNAYVFATFRAAVGQFIEKSEQVLKEAGLTDK